MKNKGFKKIAKNRKALAELFAMGKKYDNETDPDKKAALKIEIETRCLALKGKLPSEEELKDVEVGGETAI